MNNSVFAWINEIKISGILPTANCEFFVRNQRINAITSSEIARKCDFSQGLAQLSVANDSKGNVIICAIKPISTQLTEIEYQQLTQLLSIEKESLMGRFLKLLSIISFPELQLFVDFILSNSILLEKFITAKASHTHHHSYENGLFEHSIEVAEISYFNAKHLMHSDIECQAGLIAGLFHDIGKIYPTLYRQNNCYISGPHESYNFAILAKPLGALTTLNSQVFSLLSQLLAAKPIGHKTRYALEYILKQADRTSAESNFIKKQFEALPNHYHFTKVNGNVMYRLNSL